MSLNFVSGLSTSPHIQGNAAARTCWTWNLKYCTQNKSQTKSLKSALTVVIFQSVNLTFLRNDKLVPKLTFAIESKPYMNKMMNIYNDYLHLLTKYSRFTPKGGLYTPDRNCAVSHKLLLVKPVFKWTSILLCLLRFEIFNPKGSETFTCRSLT